MNLQHRSLNKELLDEENIPFEDIKKNMQELNFINTWLGGHSITISGLKKLVGLNNSVTICEIGCGGGDNLVALNNWCNQHQIKVGFIGIDINPSCTMFAASRQELMNNTTWLTLDYEKVVFDQKPDVIFSSLFCHHFTNDGLICQLKWMQKNSKLGFFINDLQRNYLAYYLIKILTKLFSSSYLVKNDAPLSVARGFKKNEWNRLFSEAKMHSYSIKWKWAFRYLIIYKNDRNSFI